jgi:hypothetical protein
MAKVDSEQTNVAFRTEKFGKNHHLSIGIFLALFGIFVFGWVFFDSWTRIPFLQVLIGAAFNQLPVKAEVLAPMPLGGLFGFTLFALSLFALIISAIILTVNIKEEAATKPNQTSGLTKKTAEKLALSILLTAFGFTYQVIGAWPMWTQSYTWDWQAQTALAGGFLVWLLFSISLFALAAGGVSLYQESKRYPIDADADGLS